MKFSFLLLLGALTIISCKQKDQTKAETKTELTASDLEAHVTVLASDEFEGRGAGYQGEKLAAEYIAAKFDSIGLEPLKGSGENIADFFQPFEFHSLGSQTPWELLKTQNVVGLLKGETLPDEYIVVGGHHDGQGIPGQADFGREIDGIVTDSIAVINDQIWNSAVDNAVSISAIIELARVLKQNNIKLKRSILFTTFSAEESGLDGSTFFVNNPPVPLNSIKAMVNLEKLVGDPEAEFLYVSYDTNPIFETLREKTDSTQSVQLIPFYPGIIANSDHYAFAQRRVPAITVGTGSQINIHTSLDHADRLDYDLLKTRVGYVKAYLVQLANADSSFKFTGDLAGLFGVSGGPATTAEKESKGFDGDVAFKVTTVVDGSTAHNAGIQPGDLIIAIDDEPVRSQEFYQGLEDVIGETEAESVVLKIIRGDETVEIPIQLQQ